MFKLRHTVGPNTLPVLGLLVFSHIILIPSRQETDETRLDVFHEFNFWSTEKCLYNLQI